MNRLTPFVLVGLLGSLAWAAPGLAWEQSVSSKGAPIHWDDLCVNYYIHEDGSDEIEDGSEFYAIQRGIRHWHKVECAGISIGFAGETNYSVTGFLDEGPVINLVLFREKNWPYTQKPVAFTSVTYNPDTGIILDADIEMNGESFLFTTNPDAEFWKIDVENTITHEAGHILGLDHTDDPEATMWYRSEPGETIKRTLEQDDIDGLCTIYSSEKPTCAEVQPQYLFVESGGGADDDDGAGCTLSSHPTLKMIPLFMLLLLALARIRRTRES